MGRISHAGQLLVFTLNFYLVFYIYIVNQRILTYSSIWMCFCKLLQFLSYCIAFIVSFERAASTESRNSVAKINLTLSRTAERCWMGYEVSNLCIVFQLPQVYSFNDKIFWIIKIKLNICFLIGHYAQKVWVELISKKKLKLISKKKKYV